MPVSVLLVDGDSSHSQGLVRALADAWLGWRVDVVPTVAGAWQRLAVGGIDVILAAEQLADGNAFDVLEMAHGIPVIVAVPEDGAARAATALRHGFRDFIVRDDEHAYLLTVPAQIEEVLEQSCSVLAREATQTLQARQHRLLNAMSRAQSLFIDGQASAAFTLLLQELLGHTSSPCGFLACVLSPGEADPGPPGSRVLRLLVQAGQWPSGYTAPGRGEEWAVMEPAHPTGAGSAAAGVLARALASRSAVVHNDAASPCPADDWPGGRPFPGTCCAQALRVGEEPVVLLLLAGRTSGYAAELPRALQPLLSSLVQMEMAQRAQAARRSVEEQLARTTALLVEKTQVLESTLDFMDQGITNVNAEGRICIFNRRYLELLEMPEDMMSRRPRVEEVVRFQAARGDFGPDFQHVDASGRDYVRSEHAAQGVPLQMPASYVRRTHTGRHVEVRTRQLPSGGRVRSFTDVTDFIAAQEALRTSEARWRSLTQLSSDWYWEQDTQFRFVRVEGANRLITGLESNDIMGKTPWELSDFGMSQERWQAHRAQLQAREVFYDLEIEYSMPDGSTIWVSVSGEPFYGADGSFLGYRGVGRNVSDRKRAEAQIERLAFFDELTGLPNRRLLMDRMERVLATGARMGQYGALLFLDLDNFKGINDTLGHEWGDQLLQQAALRLSGSVRASDTVARLGGDEFVVVLSGLPDDEAQAVIEVRALGQKLLELLNQPYLLDGREIHNTASIGTALFHGREETTHDLLKRADLAMYQAKAQGRNTLCFFDPQMQTTANARSALEADIRLGLQRAEFLPHYQPVVDAEGRVLGAEALVRWRHPQRGMVPPYEFIQVAEQTGLIMPLGQLMLRTACLQLADWSLRPETAEWTVSVNVSAHEFRHPDFVQQVTAALQESGASPRRLKIELTESLLLHDVEDTIAKMQELRAQGVGFSLDDFGTGYSSLAYLKRLPLDQLKIDQSFVRDVLTDPNDAAIACTIVALAHSLGLDVVAEGVETEGQREFLLRNGCRRFQGYLFGRPAPAEQMLAA
ncbi:EAL domain-containing response regulator [Paracidovorax wautersii]|uniref:PAS domain S-box-containing protein/diguanylate cyclase (GGDEF) domain-containing protein n=1 Tax=Paracidovorax wautersii TaxID=1177982 RepID=A0A1I2AMI1_9BURK|nr:EAL domain-containing protein [Paracidovorax wautersii]SFE45224.1 PAS domain S-box-containing protein/diguanylate cyclase (GGDEF) domain-containing protein [Paracidovorax wautersii]